MESINQTLEHVPDQVLQHLADALSSVEPETIGSKSSNLLIQACARIFAALELKWNVDALKITKTTVEGQLNEIVRQVNVRLRRVTLEADWWKEDHGPILLFANETFVPYALIPNQNGHYTAINSATGEKQRLTANLAQSFSPIAFMFYRTLPHKSVNLYDLLHFSFQGNRRDFWRLIYLQLFITALGMLVPIITGKIMTNVIPSASYSLLWQFVIALLVNTWVIGLFRVTQTLAAIRFDIKINATLQPAIWDRLLHSKLNFFRDFTSGDLVNRANGVDEIQQKMNISIFLSIINVMISLISFSVMYYYDKRLTMIALLLTLCYSIIFLFFTLKQITFQQLVQSHRGRLMGMLFQFYTAISKLKVSYSEKTAFQRWNHDYAEQIRMEYKAGKIGNFLSSFSTFYSVLITICLFIGVYLIGSDLSFGVFIIYNGLYSQFFSGLLGLVNAIAIITSIIPTYQRLKPILLNEPEIELATAISPPLQGELELQHISFRYHEDLPFILHSVSLRVKPGDFIAITGPSGSGKSTLFRILLGIEKPTSGLVLYDQVELDNWDKILFRRQIGVVLQQTMLFPGSILENIIGSRENVTLEEAWQAAALAELSADIQAMPMGMQTVVSENGKTLSIGQRQRLLLARALVHETKILFLDEATSAIDNETQARIWDNLSKNKTTRIVSAHRLETIRDATYTLHLGPS